jgi:hypothetical protein
MLVSPIQRTDAVPAETLFPTWRGLEPFMHRVAPARDALLAAHPGLAEAIAAVPFATFEAAHFPAPIVHKYNVVPDAAQAVFAAVPEALRAAWLCALMLDHMAQFEGVFAASGLHPEFAFHYADAFHRIIDQIERDPGFAVLTRDSFLKDLWLTRIVMLPAFAQVWWPRSGLSAKTVLQNGIAPTLYVFGRCGGRRPFMEGHTHDPVARAYWNEAGWGQALRLAAMALPALPHVKGVFGTAWFYDPAILEVSPRIAFAQTLQVGRGACRMKVGSNDAAIANATATSASRRNLYKDGTYLPTDYAVLWSRRDLIAAHGDSSRLI